MKKLFFILFTTLFIFSRCGSDNPIINVNNEPSDYTKIFTAEGSNNKFEVYSTSGTNFIYGYNNLAFKVYINNAEQNQGYVKFKPTMYHGIGGANHSVPVSEQFNFNSEKNMFTGYAVFIMYDTAAFWAADFNYNGQVFVDSAIMNLDYSSKTQIYAWDNSVTQKTYMLSLISPSAPRVGLNTVEYMLHYTTDMTNYTEINDAEMFIRPWMESMGHGSSNNVNPVSKTGGKYEGTANFNMAGEWFLYDSIKVAGSYITNTPAPKFILQVN